MKQFSFFLSLIVTFLTSSARFRRALFIGGLLLTFISSNASEAFYNPIVAAITGINRICVGSTATLSDITPGGVWKSFNTSIATIDQNGLVTGITMGSTSIGYTVTAIDNTSTTVFYSLTITAPTSFNCEVGYDSLHFIYLPNCDTTLCEGNKLWLSVNPNGLTPTTTWTGPNGFSATSINTNNDVFITNNITPATAGTYTVTYTIPGCVSTKSINIHTKSITLVAPVTGTTNVCAGSTTLLSDSTIGGVWSTSNNAIASVSSAGIVTGVAGGTATISYTYTNVNACSVAQTALVTVSTPVVLTCEGGIGPQYSIGGLTNCTMNACLGQNLWLSVNPNNLTNGAATWTGPNGFSSASLNTGNDILVTNSLTAAQGGVYTATYTQGVCTSVANINVIANAVPVVAPITGNNNICMGGGTTQLTDTTPGGVWKSTNTSYATISATGLVTGILSANIYMDYTVTNTVGCSTIQQFLVSINSPFVFTCEGSIDNHSYPSLPNCTMTVCEGSPLWLSVNPNFSNPPGAVWTGPNGFNSPSINSNNDVLISSAITSAQAGVYTATYTGACVSTGTITVIVNPTPVLDTIVGYATVCKGGMIQLTNTTPGGAWTSSNTNTVTINSGGIASGVVNGNSNITYTVSTASGCSAKVSKLITVTTSTQTNPLVSGPGSVCIGSSANLTTTVQNGVWSSSNTALATITNTGTVSVIAPGYVYIMYNLTNTNGCNFTAFKTINTLTKSTSTTTVNICAGSSYTFNGTSYNSSGTYTAHLTNSVGCDSAATLILTVYSPTVLDSIAGISSICIGGTIQLTNSTNGGTWTSSNNYIGPVSSNGLFTANANGTSTITYTYTNPGGCISLITKIITVNNLPYTGPIIGSNTVCTGNNDTLIAAGSGIWTTTNSSIATNVNGILTGLKAGVDTVIYTLTNSFGCTRVTTATITVLDNPIILDTIVGNTIVCVGSMIQLSNSTPGGIWSSFDHYVATISSSGLVTGNAYGNSTITYYVSNANGCHNSITKVVSTVNDPYTGPIVGSKIVCTSNNDTLRAAGAGIWTSSNPSIATINNGIVSGLTAGTDTIIYVLTNSYGCVTTTTAPITVLSNPILLDTIVGAGFVCVGSTIQLSNSITGGTWSSLSNYTSTISQTGMLTGNNNGNNTITYYVSNNNGCYAKTSKVITSINIPFAGTITGAGLLCNGNTTTLKASVSNGTWSSTNNNITTVNSSGVVTGISGGTDSIVYKITNSYGCVSTLYKSMTDASTSSITNAGICSGSSYTFNGTSYYNAGTYTAHLTNNAGCDSVATLVLTIKASSASKTNASICAGSTYTFNSTDYNTSGTYTYQTTNAAGCDSTATLVLTIRATSTSTTNLSICPTALPYSWNGLTFIAAGIQTVHLTNAAGCDSAATLVITVKASIASTTNASICSGNNYTFNGISYSAAGTYTYHTTNAAGCDSITTLNLTIKNPSTSTTTITACSSYSWNGSTYTTSGNYTYNTTNNAGCDSIATLNLTINNVTTSTTNVSICAGSSYTFNGQAYTTSGTYLAFLTNIAGCDSIATLNLIVNQPTSSTTNASICNGSSYTFNGQTYTTAGTYLSFLTNSVGCDSIATLVLTVNMPTSSSTNVTACSTYTWNATTYTTSGTYTYNTTNAKGCDSIATLNLIISNGTSSTTNISICNGSSYTFNGQTFTTAGTYLAFLTNSAGCDSVATLNLKINQLTTSVTNITNCNSFTWNGTVYSTSGTYTFHTNNAVGCDSIATLNLIINKGTSSTTNVSICNGSSYTFNGHKYNTQGTYTATLTNSVGCDSIATLNLIVTNVGQPTIQPISGTSSVCPGDSTILTDLTPGGIWSIDSTSIATIDSITGLVKGFIQGAAVVSYTVGVLGSDCSATVYVPLTINCNEVESGSTGGLESKGLGNAVAKRVYNAALSNTDNKIDYNKISPVKTSNIIQVMGTNTPGTLTLSDLMPAKESIGCGYKSYDMSSHVTDLTGFTNAEAVQTFDYVVKNETQSVTFLTRTYGNIYAHTKPVCDRLKEAKLLDVKQVSVQGMTFIQYKLQQNDGKIEYAISFSAGVKLNDNKFNIQSIWLTRNYAIQDTMYNFQVWAVEPAMARNMLNNIITKLNGILPLNQTVDSIGIPTTYITDITRSQNKLIMNIRNNTSATNGAINLTVRSNENISSTSPMSVPVTLLPNAITPVSIDVKDSYESDISLLVDNNVKDMVYMNDGNWNYSVSKTSIVPNKFTISNDGIMPTADEYRLFRNVTVDVNVPDYVSIYKMMKAGGLSRDLSGYNQLQFKASATNTGKLTIVIQKASITNWSEQYTYSMPINGDMKDYAVNLRDFKSSSSNDTLKADDIVTVTYSFIGSGNNNHIVASLADVKFSQKTITQPIVIAKTMNVFPNPATDKFSVRFVSDINTLLKLQLVEIGTGRIILNKEVNVVAGENLIPVTINTTINTDGHYVLMLGNETIKYSPFKLVLRK